MGSARRYVRHAMKQAAGLSSLRALSRSGLSAETFIPAALEAMHGVIPSYRNLFDWTDAQGNLIRYYFEGPIDHHIASHYFEEFHNGREGEVMPEFRQAINGRAVIHGADELDRPEFFRSALYNEIWRPQGLHTRIEAIVKGCRGQPLGSLVLYRAPGEQRFTRDDERLLEQAAVYIARGLEAGDDTAAAEGFAIAPSRKASITLGARGELLHLSQDALKVLLLAHGGVTPHSVTRSPRREDFATLNLLWQHHERGRGLSRDSMQLTIDNAWGRFAFDSEAMVPLAGGDPSVIHVGVQQFEPRVVSLRRALDGLCLSPAQREVCALLHRGESQQEIAAELSVAPSTVADHVRKIYAKLDVHSVGELSARLHDLCARVPA
jgi:DNA-binding CsgD family transcriptional regulator